MGFVEYKVFKDNVHGYIRVPVDMVRLFVDTEILQRLRNIEQTGMRMLFPSARHDRFIHSLGTFHLGSKAFECFRRNTKESSDRQPDEKRKHYYVLQDDENEAFWDKCGVLFETACLLHDCGHAPFSHALEFFYEQQGNDKSLAEMLRLYHSSPGFQKDFLNQGSAHERMSALVVCAEFRQSICAVLDGRGLDGQSALSDDMEFIVRMIIGCPYSDDAKTSRIKNCLISLLNSSSIDVDALDYIIRDSKLSGIDNMSVDVDRLLGSLTIIEKTIFVDVTVHNAYISTNVLNASLIGANNSSALVRGQHQGATRIYDFQGKMTGSLSAKGHMAITKEAKFQPAKNNILNVGGASYTQDHTVHTTSNDTEVELFGITEADLEVRGTVLRINKEQNGGIDFNAKRIEIDSAFITGTIDGVFTGELLGFHTGVGGRLTCELGFHKSSLSVIQNVLIARNYEYQWIFSHHKVVYYSNYLIIELFRECIRFLQERCSENDGDIDQVCRGILSWSNMIIGNDQRYHPYAFGGTDYFRPIDSDIIALYKKCSTICLIEGCEPDPLLHLLKEYFTRVYRKSLWKSYAEYTIFFSFLSDMEKRKLSELIITKTQNLVADQYGYFNEDWARSFDQFGMRLVVWVKAGSSLKALNPDDTCIVFNDATLNFRTASLSQDAQIETKMDFFYLYYEEVSPGKGINTEGLKGFIREELKSFV